MFPAYLHAPMTRRRLMLAFLIYITVDLSSPFVPGAFNFDPDECIEGVRRAPSSHEASDVSARPAPLPAPRLVLPPPSPVRPLAGGRHTVLDWLVDSREDARASGDPPPPSEDH